MKKLTLKMISEIVADVLEEKYELLKPTDRFKDLGVDSLGMLMVIVGVANECRIKGTEEEIVELVVTMETVGDVLDYVKNRISK